jgi:hypothetical protein
MKSVQRLEMEETNDKTVQLLQVIEMCFDLLILNGGNSEFFTAMKNKMLPSLKNSNQRVILNFIKEFSNQLDSIDRGSYENFVNNVKRKTDFNFVDLAEGSANRIENIMKRGKVINEKEWRLLRAYLEKLEIQNGTNDTQNIVVKLLDEYSVKG